MERQLDKQDRRGKTNIWNLKPRLHERFFARAGDAIFSQFVVYPPLNWRLDR